MAKNKSYDKKVFRLMYILNQLDSGRILSTRELKEEFNVTYRTIQRDMELLNLTGFPLMSPKKGQYSFTEGFALSKVSLSDKEASLLSFLQDIAKPLGKDMQATFAGIFKKVISSPTTSPYYVKLPETAIDINDYPLAKELEEAIDSRQKVQLKYKTEGKEKEFILDPLKILFYDGFWYLLSRIDGKDWLMKLRIENITDVELLSRYFIPVENLETILDESVNIWFSEKRDKKVVLKAAPHLRKFFTKRKYFPLQKIVQENKDGSFLIETLVDRYEEIVPLILHWMPDIHVESPQELKTRIVSIVKAYIE